jgi:hypothetical protein
MLQHDSGEKANRTAARDRNSDGTMRRWAGRTRPMVVRCQLKQYGRFDR